MRWLALVGAVVAMAVAAWWFWPRSKQVHDAEPPDARSTRPRAAEVPVAEAPILPLPPDPSVVEQDAGLRDAGVIVHAIFEQVDPNGRVAGTRFFLYRDAGTATGLADMMGIAHVDVQPGSWVVWCSSNCGHNFLMIVPGYEHFILPSVQSFTVSGVVVDEMGAPVSNAVVSWGELGEPGREGSIRTSAAGTFSFETEERTVTLTAHDADMESVALSTTVPSQHPIVLELRRWSMVYFDFPNFKAEPVAMLSIIGRRSHSYTIGERRMEWLPVGEHEAFARAWSNGKTYTAKGHFTVNQDKRRNHVQLVLSEARGLRVNVTDTHGQPLSSVTVFASHVLRPGLPIDAGCALVVTDAGAHCALDLDPNAIIGATDSSGFFEITPPAAPSTPQNARTSGALWDEESPAIEVEPMYTITLGGSWREQAPALMKLGDEPITIVAVPR